MRRVKKAGAPGEAVGPTNGFKTDLKVGMTTVTRFLWMSRHC